MIWEFEFYEFKYSIRNFGDLKICVFICLTDGLSLSGYYSIVIKQHLDALTCYEAMDLITDINAKYYLLIFVER